MKLAIITGGSRGIGAELVIQYKNEGFATKEFSRSGKSEDSIVADLSKPKVIQDMSYIAIRWTTFPVRWTQTEIVQRIDFGYYNEKFNLRPPAIRRTLSVIQTRRYFIWIRSRKGKQRHLQ